MIRFTLNRREDETGVSGIGIVAEGVRFRDGSCALRWLTRHRSTCTYDDIEAVVLIHGHGGKTAVVLDPEDHGASPFYRATTDYYQDYCEGVPQASAVRGVIVVPNWIKPENAAEWTAGYRFCLVRDLGADWSDRLRIAKAEADARHAAWLAKQ